MLLLLLLLLNRSLGQRGREARRLLVQCDTAECTGCKPTQTNCQSTCAITTTEQLDWLKGLHPHPAWIIGYTTVCVRIRRFGFEKPYKTGFKGALTQGLQDFKKCGWGGSGQFQCFPATNSGETCLFWWWVKGSFYCSVNSLDPDKCESEDKEGSPVILFVASWFCTSETIHFTVCDQWAKGFLQRCTSFIQVASNTLTGEPTFLVKLIKSADYWGLIEQVWASVFLAAVYKAKWSLVSSRAPTNMQGLKTESAGQRP